MTSYVIKLSIGTDIMRHRVPDVKAFTFTDLMSLATLKSGQAVASIKFMDEEEDLCTISSDVELEEAFRIAMSEGRKSLVLHIKSGVSQNSDLSSVGSFEMVNSVSDTISIPEEEPVVAAVTEEVAEKAEEEVVTTLPPVEETTEVTVEATVATPIEEKKPVTIPEHSPAAVDTFPIHVETVMGETITVQVTAADTIDTVKEKIAAMTGIPVEAQALFDSDPLATPEEEEVPDIVHQGVACDGCDVKPIVGDRFKCYVCDNFDLCAECEEKQVHDESHPLIQLKTSSQSVHLMGPHSHGRPHHGRRGGWRGGRWRGRGGRCHGRDRGHNKSPPRAERIARKIERNLAEGTPAALEKAEMLKERLAVVEEKREHIKAKKTEKKLCKLEKKSAKLAEKIERKEGKGAVEKASFLKEKLAKVNHKAASIKAARPFSARYIRDLTFSDGTIVTAGTSFLKTWRMHNDGDTSWKNVVLTHVGGAMSAPPVEVANIAGGAMGDVSITLTAPATPGRHCGYFRLATTEGTRFGHRIWVDILVEAAPVAVAAPVVASAPVVAAPVVAAPAAALPVATPVVEPWSAEVDMLRGMGFTQDKDTLVSLLSAHNGDMTRVVSSLFA